MFTCTVCGKSFTGADSFMRHERSHAEQMLSCGICANVGRAKKDLMTTTPESSTSGAKDKLSGDQGMNYFNIIFIGPSLLDAIFICMFVLPFSFRIHDETLKF